MLRCRYDDTQQNDQEKRVQRTNPWAGGGGQLNAVEGIYMSREMHCAFAEFDSLGLSPEQRRRRLMKQFGGQSG